MSLTELYSCRRFISYVWHRLPDEQHHVSELRKPSKALGDPSVQIATQSMATYAHDFSASDLDAFMNLAKRYIFEGRDRSDICAYNSGVKPVYHCVCDCALKLFLGCFFSWSRICSPILAATWHCINEIYTQFVTKPVSFSTSEIKQCVHPFQSSTIPSRFLDECSSWSTWLGRFYCIKPPLCTPTRVYISPFEHKCGFQFTKHRESVVQSGRSSSVDGR